MTLKVWPEVSSGVSHRLVRRGEFGRIVVGLLAGGDAGLAADAQRGVVEQAERLRAGVARFPRALAGAAPVPQPQRRCRPGTLEEIASCSASHTSADSLLLLPVFFALSISSASCERPRFFASFTPAPAAAPATAASTAAARQGDALALFLDDARARNAAALNVLHLGQEWIGFWKPIPCSVQPMQGWPQPTGQVPAPTSPNRIVGQLA